MTYTTLGKIDCDYSAPVWSTNASKSNIGKIQRAHKALRIIPCSHKMSSIDHLHSEAKMLHEPYFCAISGTVPGYRECLSPHHQDRSSTKGNEGDNFTRHYQTVLPLLANNRKDTRQALHTSFINTVIDNMKHNRVLNNRPPPINDEETLLSRRQGTTLLQLRSGHCKLLKSYKKRLNQSDSSSCPDCGMDPHDVSHLFDCTAHPNDLSPVNVWDRPIETIRELIFLDPGNLD